MSNFFKQALLTMQHIMFNRSFCFMCAVLLFAAIVCAQESPDGHWEGSIPEDFDVNRPIGVSLDLSKNAHSEWVASMGVPSEKVTGLVVQSVKVNGASVSFVAVEMMMTKFDLTLGAGGIMKGTITAQQGPPMSASVEFKRIGEAKIELIAVSPAVSKELEGDWEGTLVAGPGALFPMVFHFKNQPDKTVSATMDSPARNALAIPLNDVKQNGQNVEFGIKVAHASFQGTLNQAGTELAGKLIHEGVGTAMTLKRAIMAGAADNPFIGTWKLNLQKSRFSNPAPKSSTITFFAMENGMIFLLETVDSTGKVSQFRAAEPFDGEVKGESVIPGATVTGTRVDSNTVVLVFKKDGNEVRRVTENASKDGKTLTRTRKEKNTEGIELEDIAVFEKQQ